MTKYLEETLTIPICLFGAPEIQLFNGSVYQYVCYTFPYSSYTCYLVSHFHTNR